MEIPEIETVELPHSTNLRTETLQELVFRTVVGVTSFCPVTMFAERGPYSGHVYQPRINHRDVDFHCYSHRQKSSLLSKPLCESMISPNEETGFSVGALMGLYCFEVIKVDQHPTEMSGVLESPATLSHVFGDELEEVMNAMAEISKVKAASLTTTTFQRLLTVFGLHRNKEYSTNDTVDVREIADFFETLCKHNIGTMEGLKKFVNDFHLSRFYYVTDCKPVPDQISSLSTVIRALVPFQVGAYDGRHRFALCCYFASGIFNPTNSLIQKRSFFGTSQGGKEKRFEDCELFRDQTFHVATDRTPPENDLAITYSVMVKLGGKTTTAQELSVKTDWRSTISDCLSAIQNNSLARTKLHQLTFDNFWSAKEWELPYTHIVEDIISFIKGSRESRKNLMIGGIKQDWEVIEEAIRDTASSPAYFLGNLVKGKAPLHIPRLLSIFLILIKFVVVDEMKLEKLRNFFQLNECSTPQGEIHEDDFTELRSLPFIQSFILYPCVTVWFIACKGAESKGT